MDDDLATASAYTLNCWDCPVCGHDHRTDMDLGTTETCDGCGREVEISG